jgi:RNA polymerase sigma-70 factor (ECF subfamily)
MTSAASGPHEEPAAGGFDELYETALVPVYSYLFHRSGGVREVAEDLTQEVFVAAARRIRDGHRVNEAWCIVVARNKLVDHFRAAERDRRSLRLVRDRAADRAEDLDVDLSRDEVLEVLRSLPAAQQAAVVLRYFDDLSVLEVAQRLGRSERATEGLLRRGRAGFRVAYREKVDG